VSTITSWAVWSNSFTIAARYEASQAGGQQDRRDRLHKQEDLQELGKGSCELGTDGSLMSWVPFSSNSSNSWRTWWRDSVGRSGGTRVTVVTRLLITAHNGRLCGVGPGLK